MKKVFLLLLCCCLLLAQTGSLNVIGGVSNLTGITIRVDTQSQSDNSTKIASTAYTDLAVANAVAGVNPAVAVLAASTATIVGSYNNGASGIGAFFTVTATGAFTLDGVAINTIGQRVLLKNQSSAFQNGVYTATIVGALAVSPVFTRALDYNQPSDINSTGAIPVQSGTVNGTTSWLLTSQVATVGTDALTYVQFSVAPAKLIVRSCVVIIGDPGAGSPVLANDNDSPVACSNDYGSDWTLTTVACWADAGAPTVTPILTGGSGTSILTGALTCGTAAWAAGTVQGTAPVVHSFSGTGATCSSTPCTADVNITTAGGVAKYIVVKIVGTL